MSRALIMLLFGNQRGYILLKLTIVYCFLAQHKTSWIQNSRIKFDKDPLPVEQNNFAIKLINAYIVYDLDAWPNNPLNNFELKNCLFGATNTAKKSGQEKLVCNGQGLAFDRAGSWNFGNDFNWKIVIFRVDNSFFISN